MFSQTNQGFEALIERLNSDSRKHLWPDQAFDSRTPKFGWWRKQKLNSIKTRIEYLRISRDYENTAYDLWLILQGSKYESLNWLRLLGDREYEKSIHSWIQRQVILQGLRSLESEGLDQRNGQMIKKMRANLSWLFKVELRGLASLPFSFPLKADAQISVELLEKVLLEGVEKHKPELQKLYGEQKITDYYHALRPFLQFIGFVAMGLLLDELSDELNEYQGRKNARQIIDEVQDLNASLDELVIEVRRRKGQR